jgi:hypothetical protein
MTRKIIYLTVMARRSMALGVGPMCPGPGVVVEQPVKPKLSPPEVIGKSRPAERSVVRFARQLRLDLSAQRLLMILKERDPGLYEEVRKVLA